MKFNISIEYIQRVCLILFSESTHFFSGFGILISILLSCVYLDQTCKACKNPNHSDSASFCALIKAVVRIGVVKEYCVCVLGNLAELHTDHPHNRQNVSSYTGSSPGPSLFSQFLPLTAPFLS